MTITLAIFVRSRGAVARTGRKGTVRKISPKLKYGRLTLLVTQTWTPPTYLKYEFNGGYLEILFCLDRQPYVTFTRGEVLSTSTAFTSLYESGQCRSPPPPKKIKREICRAAPLVNYLPDPCLFFNVHLRFEALVIPVSPPPGCTPKKNTRVQCHFKNPHP